MKRLCLILIVLLFASTLASLPTDDVYWDRVSSGLERTDEMEPFVHEIIQQERKLQESHYQVITAKDPRFLAYHVILKELYRLTYHQDFEHFEFLRTYQDPDLRVTWQDLFDEHPELLQSEGNDDTVSEISKQLISASLTLETMVPKESALDVFVRGTGVSIGVSPQLLARFLLDAFAQEGFSVEGVNDSLISLIEKQPISREGILLQVFIAKEKIEDVAYVSHPKGFFKQTSNIHAYFQDHEAKRDSSDFDTQAVDQVRLLAGALDPAHTKIYMYSTLDPESIEAYRIFVRAELIALIETHLLKAA